MLTIDRLYSSCAVPRIKVHSVQDSLIRKLTRVIRETSRAAHEDGLDSEVGRRLAKVKAVRFCLAASPVNGAAARLRLSSFAQRLESEECEIAMTANGRVAEAFALIRPIITELSSQEKSPLGEKLLDHWHQSDRLKLSCAIVVPQNSLKAATEEWLSQFGTEARIPVLTPSALRGAEFFDKLFVFGAPRWYLKSSGDFMFATPRTENLHLIGYSWSDLSLNLEPVFHKAASPGGTGSPFGEGSATRDASRVVIPKDPESNAADTPNAAIEEDPDDESSIDAQAILNWRRANQYGEQGSDEEVEARMVMLSGGDAVILPWTDDAKSFCANFGRKFSGMTTDEDDEDSGSVRRTLNQELQAGDFIILRTGAAGDILPQVADSIMTEPVAREKRAQQGEWKGSLRSAWSEDGPEALSIAMKAAGATHASVSNIRNWIRERTIRPEADEDFDAILKVCGLHDRRESFFETADLLNSMHRKAGFKVRRLLIAEVKKADLRPLFSAGKMTFKLRDLSDEASMSAYRIERILPNSLTARLHEVNDVFRHEEDLWQ